MNLLNESCSQRFMIRYPVSLSPKKELSISSANRGKGECAGHPFRGPFLECVSLTYEWAGCCGNCKFRDWAQKCSHNDGTVPDLYRTTPDARNGGPAGLGAAQAAAAPPADGNPVTNYPYDIEEPEDKDEGGDGGQIPAVRQLGQ
jgi:hypothetical protein